MKKKLLLVLIFLTIATAAGAIAFSVFFWPDSRFGASDFARLNEGMTRDEVSAVLGTPPGDYTKGAGTYRLYSAEGVVIENFSVADNKERLERCWCGKESAIEVYFDDDGRLSNKWYYSSWPPPPTIWEEITAWLSFNKK